MSQGADDVQRVARAIADYLRRNPRAGDSLEGVLVWLGALGQSVHRSVVQQALEQLVQQGQMVKQVKADGQPIYFKTR